MEDIIQMINSPEVNLVGAVFKLFLSMILGAAIGIERRRKGQSAGMRTFALISMGACLAMLISIFIPQTYLGLKSGDPGRIAAQVISGIGFLGAGAIIQMKGAVRGLTTAAGIWITACLGLAVGAGMYAIAICVALLIILALMLMEVVEKYFLNGVEAKIVRIKVSHIVSDVTPYTEKFNKYGVHVSSEYLRYDYASGYTILNYLIRSGYKTDYVGLFADINTLGDIVSITLSNEVSN